MKNVLKIANALVSAGLLTVTACAANADVDIPVVPASVIRDGVPPHIDSAAAKTSANNGLARVNDSSVLIMEPGVNQIVPVAIGHLNRIVTPFDKPAVNTTSDASTKVEKNVVYVSTAGEMPVTMFLTEDGDESRALSLTLVPQKIPPRELFLRMPEHLQYVSSASNSRAQSWESSQPYIETIRSLFRHIALGEVPQGYTMSRMSSAVRPPACQMPGVSFDFSKGQLLNGHSLSVVIGVARNTGGGTVEISEASCGEWDIAAVAAWPKNVLSAGEATEIYIARKVKRQSGPVSKRPSLVGGY